MKRLLPMFVVLAILGQGCLAPASSPAPATSTATPSPENAQPSPTPAPTPTPTPTPVPKPSGTTVKPKTMVVDMVDFAFSPQVIAINAGDTVTWKNTGNTNHTTRGILNGPLVWDSGTLAPGQSFSRTFPVAGSFGYSCGIHPSMTGQVIVGAVNAGQ